MVLGLGAVEAVETLLVEVVVDVLENSCLGLVNATLARVRSKKPSQL